jgi:spoIIIJ-associated protein
VEWVETTGKTIEEAKDAALDQLGVDEQDAEFEVVEEPRTGLFGRTRGEARVRARVRPTQPRPKVERRERRSRAAAKGPKTGGERGKEHASKRAAAPRGDDADDPAPDPDDAVVHEALPTEVAAPEPAPPSDPRPVEDAGAAAAPGDRGGRGNGRERSGRKRGSTSRPRSHDDDDDQESIEMTDTELAEQGEVVRDFLLDLLDAFGLDGDVVATPAEEGAVELDVTGADLGLLIGPKGQTLQAIQELSRSVLQRARPGEVHARVRVDVSGYRQRRKEALQRFVQQIAEDVKSSGAQKALEPMSPPDRKVVHDTVNEIDGVHTVSEGEDARRRVVILPD